MSAHKGNKYAAKKPSERRSEREVIWLTPAEQKDLRERQEASEAKSMNAFLRALVLPNL